MKILYISLTNKCNKSCGYCPIVTWRNKPEYPDNLPFKELTEFISKFKPDLVELTGGEPTLYEHYEELCQWLKDNKFLFITKSNGTNPGYNMASAWHDEFPKHYDIIIIIDELPDFLNKINHCVSKGIPFIVIDEGPKSKKLYSSPNFDFNTFEALFVCPDGRVKWCHTREYQSEDRDNQSGKDAPNNSIFTGIEYKPCKVCKECKQVQDLARAYDKLFDPEIAMDYTPKEIPTYKEGDIIIAEEITSL